MAIYELKTFDDIVDAIREELGIQSGDTVSITKIKRAINTHYLEEIIPAANWKWLRDQLDVSHQAFIDDGTATVTEGSVTVTLTSAPSNSVEGYWFSVSGQNEHYRIAKHTAASATVTLEAPFTGATASGSSYKIWSDRVRLPSRYRETFEVRHDFMNVPLQPVGIQKFRELVASEPKAEGRPIYYCTNDYIDPAPYSTISGLPSSNSRSSAGLVKTLVFDSSVASYLTEGDQIELSGGGHYSYNGRFIVSSVSTTTITYSGNVEYKESSTVDNGFTVKLINSEKASELQKELLVFPSLTDTRTTLHLDLIKHVVPLEDDTDEPVIPLEDRVVLMYGALSRLWHTLLRNPEEGQRNRELYETKLAKMKARVEDSPDYPLLKPNPLYLQAKRRRNRRWNNNGN